MPENPSPPRPTPPPPVPPPEPLPPNPSPAPPGETVAVALCGTQHIRHISLTLPTGKRRQFYFPTGNKKRSAGSTLAAQAASL